MMTTRFLGSYKLRSRTISKSTPRLKNSSGNSRRARRRIKTCTESNSVADDDNRQSVHVYDDGEAISGRSPSRTISSDDEDEVREVDELDVECAKLAMKHFNRRAWRKGEPSYEIVDYGFTSGFSGPHIENCTHYHCNFKAKPKYRDNSKASHQSETMLFFGQLRLDYAKPMVANKCVRLGPAGRVWTGLSGCIACAPGSSDPLHHPADGDFNVGEPQYFLAPRHTCIFGAVATQGCDL